MKNDSAKKTKPPLPFKKLNSCVSVGRGGKKLLFCFPPSHLIFFLGKKTKYLPSEILLTMIYKGLGLFLPISSLGETPSGVVSPAAGKKAFKIIFIFRFSPVWDAPLAPAQRPCALVSPLLGCFQVCSWLVPLQHNLCVGSSQPFLGFPARAASIFEAFAPKNTF